jgi:sugar phosphate isomerase/epimerase
MDLCLYTDSVPELTFEDALDLAVRTGCRSIEIATGGQSSAPHLRIEALLTDHGARRAFEAAFASRGLRIAALNCSAWPLHPVRGEADARLIRDTIRLAGELGVDRIVTMSGCPGDGPRATTIDWLFYPWPSDAVALLERQWEIAIRFWTEIGALASANGVTRIAFELHPLHLVYNVPTLLRMRDAVGPVIVTRATLAAADPKGLERQIAGIPAGA